MTSRHSKRREKEKFTKQRSSSDVMVIKFRKNKNYKTLNRFSEVDTGFTKFTNIRSVWNFFDIK
jgi:hypothetical protein